ncbi:MAG: hypothetical protein SGBAC_004913 [Bacillariaceae sp.]
MVDTSSQSAARKRVKRQRDAGRSVVEYPKIPNVPMDVIPGFVEAIRASAKVLQYHCHRPFLDHEAEYQKCGNPNRATNDNNDNYNNSNNYNNSINYNSNNNHNSDQQQLGNLQPTTTSRNNSAATVIHDQLMNRVQNAADRTKTAKEEAKLKRLEKQKFAIDDWIASVKRFAYQTTNKSTTDEHHHQQRQQDSQSSSSSNNNNNNNHNTAQQQAKKERPSVPYACFLYLWDLQQEAPTKLHVRRAALYLANILLQKSKDCRFHLQMDSNLADWIVQMTTVPKQSQPRPQHNSETTTTTTTTATTIASLALLQHEALKMLHKLQEQGYAKLYPKLAVAATRLRQQCPPLPSSTTSCSDMDDDLNPTNARTEQGNNPASATTVTATITSSSNTILHRNMVDWRTIRDLALKYGNKELKRLEKLICRCEEALEILVPRMGQQQFDKGKKMEEDSLKESTSKLQSANEINASQAHVETSIHDENDNDDDDDDDMEFDDIDWEDGDEALEEKEQELMAHHPVHHLLAVDQTLAVMQSAAGGLHGGRMEIDMRKEAEKEPHGEVGQATEEAERMVEAKATLGKLVKTLREKHLQRLSLWLDGLANADNLVKKSKNTALVLLPGPAIQQRPKLIRDLTAAKKSISSILSSAIRLEEKKNQTTESSNNEIIAAGDTNQNPLMFGAIPRPSDTRRIQTMLVSRSATSKGRSALSSAIARHQKRKRVAARSSRIQIKVKSRRY